MFLSKHMTLYEAWQIVNERTNSTGRGPIWQALKEGAVSAELWQNEKWIPAQAEWWNDPEINWPVSPYGLFPNLPDASMFRVERRIIDKLWPTSDTAGPVRKSRKATQPLRPKGKPATTMNRIIAEMRGMDRTELCEMKLKAMQHQFGAAASTCKKARDTVRG